MPVTNRCAAAYAVSGWTIFHGGRMERVPASTCDRAVVSNPDTKTRHLKEPDGYRLGGTTTVTTVENRLLGFVDTVLVE
jgi:hypothetical protein